ncbi:MAG TPA: GTPase RsgA [Gaiellaceae bacterium]|nr:GTPase RsgA [Gaiellaceae bacterium]
MALREETIVAMLPRRSAFSRKAAWAATEEQVLAANIDTVFVVGALDGDLNLRRLERYLTLAWESGATPAIVLTKADLCEDVGSALVAVEPVAMGVPALAVSNVTGAGLDRLEPYLAPARTVALLGSSGVGKSSLVNRLAGIELQATREIAADGRGRHTTTRRQLVWLPSGALLVDTPGLRELQLWTRTTASTRRSRTWPSSPPAAASASARTPASPAARCTPRSTRAGCRSPASRATDGCSGNSSAWRASRTRGCARRSGRSGRRSRVAAVANRGDNGFMRTALVASAALVLAGCGGGGGERTAVAPAPRHVCEPTRAPPYAVCGYPLQKREPSSIWRSFGRSAVELTGPAETVRQDPHPSGFWVRERLFVSPDGKTLLAQWSGQCEVQSTYLVSAETGRRRAILAPADESSALGWTKAGLAKIRIPRPVCGGAHLAAGIYAVDPVTLKPTLLRRVKPRPGGA